jgi:hypothetical protein
MENTSTNQSFVFYETFRTAANELEAEDKVALYEAIIEYGLFTTEPTFTKKYMNAIWVAVKTDIDGAKKRRKFQTENGNKGGRPRKDGTSSVKVSEVKVELIPVIDNKPQPEVVKEVLTPFQNKLSSIVKTKGLNPNDEERFLYLIKDNTFDSLKDLEIELSYLYQ